MTGIRRLKNIVTGIRLVQVRTHKGRQKDKSTLNDTYWSRRLVQVKAQSPCALRAGQSVQGTCTPALLVEGPLGKTH